MSDIVPLDLLASFALIVVRLVFMLPCLEIWNSYHTWVEGRGRCSEQLNEWTVRVRFAYTTCCNCGLCSNAASNVTVWPHTVAQTLPRNHS
jgi:hypothetical protein